MAILVVGGAGYIGSHAARLLRQNGYEVIIYDNLSTGHRFLADGFELVVGDMADREKLLPLMMRSEAIMCFAAHAYVGESVENPRKYFHNNVSAGLQFLDTAMDAGVRHFVFSSSCAVYGVPPSLPIVENTPRQPINPYGTSKAFFENALDAYHTAYGLHYASLRYFNAAGADESGQIGEIHDPETHLIPLALAAAAGTGPELEVFGSDYPTPDGTCIRDYVHVNDIAEAHVLALRLLLSGETQIIVNLGTGRGYTIKEILNSVQEVTGRNVPSRQRSRRPGDPPVLVADPARALRVMGWEPRRSLTQIVSTAWNWMRVGNALVRPQPLNVHKSGESG